MRTDKENIQAQQSITILRLQDVMARTGLRRTMIYTLIKEGKFPRQIPLSDRCVGWDENEVGEFLAQRRAARG